ncbi:MAG: OmpH family outer membrane protein [Bacteroidetes bacterium]|nr:OmpH family outer membrane protein [Bacteroidota bacterium]
MKNTFVLTLALLLAVCSTTHAQKFGYCNSDLLLAQIPEVKEADSNLKDFQGHLTKQGQERVKALQDAATELQRKKEQGTISPKDYETQAGKLKEEESSIAAFEKEVYEKLAKKREELFKPLLDKVNAAMEAVAKENGFMLVFDSNNPFLLYAADSLDVTKLVKTKLGITN